MKTRIALVALILALAVTVNATSTIVPGHFKFTLFSVPNSTSLSLIGINNTGTVVGSYTIAAGATIGVVRRPDGTTTSIVEPQDRGGSTAGFTSLGGINDLGVIVGYNFNTAGNYYQGFFLQGTTYTPFVFPNQPPLSTTEMFAINDLGSFGGYVLDAPNYTTADAFLSQNGRLASFTVQNSDFSEVIAINNLGWSAGTFQDATGFYHGFLRDPHGDLTVVDVPTANTVNGQGTVLIGLNDFGLVSGHFWDTAGNEHGFVGFPGGRFFQIDVPDATATSGGGVNDLGQVTGHWTDTSGVEHGYIATPQLEGE